MSNTAMEIAGISPEEIAKWRANGFGNAANVTAADKSAGRAAAAEQNILSRWIHVTPDMARRWLKSNFRNRPVKDDVVAAYARDMANGVWTATHQGIAFNDRDELIDGQHRLLAIIRCGKTVRMLVTFGLASKIEGTEMTTMDCVDRGATRSVADQLKIQHGLKAGTQIAQVAGTIAHLCVGERMRRLSVGQTLDIYREFKTGMDYVIANRSKEPGLRSAGVLGAFAFCYPIYGEKIHGMFLTLNSGAGIEAWPATAKLREFLTGENATLILASMNRGIGELTAWMIANWKETDLAKEPEAWLKAVEHFRAQQPERVNKIANIFQLPGKTAAAVATVLPPPEIKKPAAPAAPVEPAPAPATATRPKLDRILSCVEVQSKLSRFILTGRGSDGEIDAARSLFVTIARSYGYTEEIVALTIKKNPAQIKAWNLPKPWTKKFAGAVDTIKAKL